MYSGWGGVKLRNGMFVVMWMSQEIRKLFLLILGVLFSIRRLFGVSMCGLMMFLGIGFVLLRSVLRLKVGSGLVGVLVWVVCRSGGLLCFICNV